MGEYAVTLANGTAAAWGAFAAGIRRPPRLSVTEWADAHRRLPTKGAGEPGPWRTRACRTPTRSWPAWRRASGQAHRLHEVGASAGTEIGNNWAGWFI